MDDTLGPDREAKASAGVIGNGAHDSIPDAKSGPIPYVPPRWQSVLLGRIELDPRLSRIYAQKCLRFLPDPPPGFLTAKGIRMAARLLPIHGVAHEGKVLCFAGVRLWLAAVNTLPLDSKIEMLVHQSFLEERLAEIVEMEEDILYVWHRQSKESARQSN